MQSQADTAQELEAALRLIERLYWAFAKCTNTPFELEEISDEVLAFIDDRRRPTA